MASISQSATIPVAASDVWAKLSDIANSGDWLATHVGFPDGAPAALEPGTTYKENVTIMGMPGEVVWTIASVDPGSRLELTGVGPMGTQLSASYEVQEDGEGSTTVTFESGFEGAALAAMEAPLLTASEKALNESLEKLKGILAV